MKVGKEILTLECSGRNIKSEAYLIGIGQSESGKLYTGSGYDMGVDIISGGNAPFMPLTLAEREELSDYMISLWERFKSEDYHNYY